MQIESPHAGIGDNLKSNQANNFGVASPLSRIPWQQFGPGILVPDAAAYK
jgi:hypothetical protein